MLVWAKKVPEDGERGKTEYQHAVQGINHDGRIAKSDEAEPEWMLVSGDEIQGCSTLYTSGDKCESTVQQLDKTCEPV